MVDILDEWKRGRTMRLHHAAVVCRSEENADRFYQGVLGLKRMKSSNAGKDLIQQIFDIPLECQFVFYGNENIGFEVFIHSQKTRKSRHFEHLCLELENRDAFMAKCRAHGLEVREIPKGETMLVFIKDYDGNIFEIKEC